MKKIFGLLVLSLIILLAACGTSDDKTEESADKESNEPVELVVGASSTPHAEILEEAKNLLKDEGITLTIETYQDYILPNEDLENGTLDANFFQHIPYLEQTVADTGYDLDYIDGIHIEPMGVYSKNITSIDEIRDGTEVIMSRSIPDHGRILSLFEQQGLIKLDENAEKSTATLDDIVENPRELTFSADVDPLLLPEMYLSEADALVAINTNYAIDADLNPLKDALFIEDENSEYVNVIGVRANDKDNPELNKLVEILQSEEIQNYILDTYEGAVVPVGGNN
ncbi:MetQ/NlpA family ABC transporter substrate-binding protein [Oceanobacillus sp. FSL H7-0719]|uniref:MetQ/NlpA family ABC transporter substrate-binding protein n=1 Tax=Oceanobacillus sp. FSL H7-0719 TaxID=2954507 RepID=UPI003246CCF8